MALNLSTLDGTTGFRLDGATGGDYSGWCVSAAGDFNGDGIDDLIVGAPGGSNSYAVGASFVVFGTDAGFAATLDLAALDGSDGLRLNGAFGRSGYSVSAAGDVDGDGIDDLVIGAPYADTAGSQSGASYVVFGSDAGFAASLDLAALDGSDGFRLDGSAGDRSGDSVSAAGDVNSDGIDDLIVGTQRAGAGYVVFGSDAGFAASLDLAALGGSNGFRLAGAGSSVSAAGDVNGDGIDDLIVGAPDAANYAGASYVLFGSDAGFAASVDLAALDGSGGFRVDGAAAQERSGSSVSAAGDVNGDGIDDLIVGAPGAANLAGASYVLFGSDAGFAASVDLAALDGSDGFRLDGAIAGDYSGTSVSAAGDVNGDRINDLIIGAPLGDTGASYVVFGSDAGFAASLDVATLAGSDGFRLDGATADDWSGWSVSAAGDVNSDGIDDLIVGATRADTAGGNRAGASYVVFGSTQLGGDNDAPVAADDWLVVGADQVDLAADNGAGTDRDPDFDDLTIVSIDGVSVASGGSVTLASGLRVTLVGGTEVVFDVPGAALGTHLATSFIYEISDGRGGSDTAAVAIDFTSVAASLAGLDGTNGFRLDGAGRSGWSVSAAGDVNGDGIDDVIVGAPFASTAGGNYTGASYVVFGTDAGFAASLDLAALDGSNGFRLDGAAGDNSGVSVSTAGDVNGDGIDDLIVGAPRAGMGYFGNASGSSYVVFGTSAGFAATLDLTALDGSDGFRLDGSYGDFSGGSVSAAGDINGDGIDDLIVGAAGAQYGDGASYVLFGTEAGFAASLGLGSNGFRLEGNGSLDYVGRSVSDAGDVNGDGIDDVIVGAPHAYTAGRYNAGASFVVFGTKAGFPATLDLAALDGSNGFRLDGAADDYSGSSVSAAGDVNGDGIDDLIVGAPADSFRGGGHAAASYVVFGTDAGFAASLDLAALDGSDGFRLAGAGSSVSAAGDFNGDSIDDLIVSGGGASYVVFGSAAGFAATLDLAALDGLDGFRIVGAGDSVAGAGDVNGDGIDDLIVGASSANGGAGASYVVFGFRTGGASTTEVSVTASPDDAEQAGKHVQLASKDLDIGDGDNLVGLRFTGLEVPDGATITGAHIEFQARLTGGCPADLTIAVEDTADAASFGSGGTDIAGRDYLDQTTAWSPEAWAKGGTYQTADLAAMLAALVGTDGIDADDALAFRISGNGERTAWSFDGEGEAPRLVIEYEGADASSAAIEGATTELPVDTNDQADRSDPADTLAWSDLFLA